MAYIDMRIASGYLGKGTGVGILMPQTVAKGEKLKCLYLLHGLSDDYTSWHRNTSLERYASKYRCVIVMPDGAKSFYCDMKSGDGYYSYIAKELPEIIEGMFPVSDKREDRYIAGLSMGGYGALKIGLREDGRYRSIAALSPASDMVAFLKDNEWFNCDAIFGPERIVPDEDNVLLLAEKCVKRPDIYLAIGKNDWLYNNNRALKQKLLDLCYDFTYTEEEGDHDWEFWDRQVKIILHRFFS